MARVHKKARRGRLTKSWDDEIAEAYRKEKEADVDKSVTVFRDLMFFIQQKSMTF